MLNILRFALRAFSAERVNKAGNQYMHLTHGLHCALCIKYLDLHYSVSGGLGVRAAAAQRSPTWPLGPVGLGATSQTYTVSCKFWPHNSVQDARASGRRAHWFLGNILVLSKMKILNMTT